MAAVIRRADGMVLISLRPRHVDQGSLWEFPGGKRQPGESRLAALRRELFEELGIGATHAVPLIQVLHQYSTKTILLDVWEVTAWGGEASGCEGQAVRWVKVSELSQYQFPGANHPVITAAALPRLLLITPEPGDSDDQYLQRLRARLQAGIRLVQLRAKRCGSERYRGLAGAAKQLCDEFDAQLMVNADPALAQAIGAAGVHLPGAQLQALTGRPLGPGFLVSAACHTPQELAHATRAGVDFALLSPVKSTASHVAAEPLGWQNVSAMVRTAKIPVYALGGMTPGDLGEAVAAGCQGIAAIRALWEHPNLPDEAGVLAAIARHAAME